MQQYLIYAWDGTDAEAMERRMKTRPDHFISAKQLKASNNFIIGGALLDEQGEMKGSMMLVQFETRDGLDQWMKQEPYITQNVWQKIDIHPFRVADI